MHGGGGRLRLTGETPIRAAHAGHAEGTVGTHDDVLRHARPGLHGAERQELRAHRDLRHDPAFDVHGNLGCARIVGNEDQLTIHIARGGFWFEPNRQVIGGLARAVHRFRQRDLEIRIGTPHVLDLPGRAADVGHADRSLSPLAEVDVAQIDKRRVEGHITTDVSGYPQLHLGEVRLVERDGERGPVLAEERPRVELGDDLAGLVRLEVANGDLGRRAAAAGPHADDVQGFLVDVAEHEAVFRLRSLGYRAEVMARAGEHLRGPFLCEGRVRRRQHDRERTGGKQCFAESHRSRGKHACDTRGDEGCHGCHGCRAETCGGRRKAYGWHERAVNVSRKRGEGRNTSPPCHKYPRWKVSGRETSVFPAKKWLPGCDTTDTGRGVSNTGRVYRID